MTHRWDPKIYNHTWLELIWKWCQWKDTLHSPKFQDRTLTLRCSFVSSPGQFWGESHPSVKVQSVNLNEAAFKDSKKRKKKKQRKKKWKNKTSS